MSTIVYTNPNPWVPPQSTGRCPQSLCNPDCPRWCFLALPPPPPFYQTEDDSSSGNSLSPLVIAIIGILASALLLITYYAFLSRYCSSNRGSSSGGGDEERPASAEGGQSRQDAWQMQEGLDEAVIKSIATCRYKEGDGFVDGKECSVCLAEFREEEEVRLLPRCCHAFHVQCIDQWLKGHTSCPVCRANVPPVSVEMMQSRWGGGGESYVVVMEKVEGGSTLTM